MIQVLGAAAGEAGAAVAFIELGGILIGLALLGRLATRVGFSPIPLYLLAGLAFGTGGILPLDVSEDFIAQGAQLGVVLLLFMLGLEYTGEELKHSLRGGWTAGLVDLGLNFPPGFVAGLLLGWSPLAATLLGGVTYISSSGVVAKLLGDLAWTGNRETPTVLTILVVEDLAMAVYLPIIAVLLAGAGLMTAAFSLAIAVGAVSLVLYAAVRWGHHLSRAVASESDEVVLLTVLGLLLLVGGGAERLQVSSAVGAFLVGIALSGTVADRARGLVGPLRDLFAATFFVFFGLQIDPGTIPSAAPAALTLGVVTAGTKIVTGWWSAKRNGIAMAGRLRAGTVLVARGEFSIVIAGLGVAAGVERELGPLAATYVLTMAVIGPLVARLASPVAGSLRRRAEVRAG